MRFLHTLFRFTLSSVIFGIALLFLITLYVAIGSGFPAVRAYFEMNDLEFFNAWPLKLLMLLLCVTLATVTANRIPLTPPRYGVWCIHSGIITLILGMALYYHFKVEGKTLIPVGRTVSVFYDSAERALYARPLDRTLIGMHDLPSLPRFAATDTDRQSSLLKRGDLTNIQNFMPVAGEDGSSHDLSSWLGLKDKVTLDIVGFYPYADVVQDVVPDPSSDAVGIEVKIASPHAQSPESTLVLTASDPTASHQILGTTELEHRDVSDASLQMIRQSANSLFQLSVATAGAAPKSLDIQIGGVYSLPGGYTLTIDSFNPAFPMSATHEVVRALTIHIIHDDPAGKKEFWRMILEGRELQTDFKMDPATTPPFIKGNRQKKPLDENLVLGFRLDDPASLLPNSGGEDKHTFITSGDKTFLDFHASMSKPLVLNDFSESGGAINLSFDGLPAAASVHRMNHFRVLSRAVETAPAARNKDEAEAGLKQVVDVRVTCGSFSQTISIPFDLYPLPDALSLEPMNPWSMGVVRIPGANAPLQLQLGNACRPMPAALTLRKFEMVHYPGGSGESGPFRDFRSTLEIASPGGDRDVAVASLNDPVYFDGGKWIFFQAGYDPDGQASTIGVGNRPGVMVMIIGCIMIVVGLMYAFYVKPIVISRMKAAALKKFAANPKHPKEKLVPTNSIAS